MAFNVVYKHFVVQKCFFFLLLYNSCFQNKATYVLNADGEASFLVATFRFGLFTNQAAQCNIKNIFAPSGWHCFTIGAKLPNYRHGLEYQISIITLSPGYPELPSCKFKEVTKIVWRDMIGYCYIKFYFNILHFTPIAITNISLNYHETNLKYILHQVLNHKRITSNRKINVPINMTTLSKGDHINLSSEEG